MIDLEKDFPWLYQQFREKEFHYVRRTDTFLSGFWADLTIDQIMMHSIKRLGGFARKSEMDESTRNILINTLYQCAAIEQSMQKITKTVHQTSEKQVESGKSKGVKDNADPQKLYSWLKQFNSVDLNDCRLKWLKSGFTAKESDGN